MQRARCAGQEICALLLEVEVNVHFAYPLMIQRDGCTLMVLHVDETEPAAHVLTRHGVILPGDEALADPT